MLTVSPVNIDRHVGPYVTYIRSTLTHATSLFLVGVTLLFFGGLYLHGGTVPPVATHGWAGPAAAASPMEVGLALGALSLSGGMVIAYWRPASWGESAALFAIVIGIHVLTSGGEGQVHELLEALGHLWEEPASRLSEDRSVGW